METHFREPAAAPDPMAADRVNQKADGETVDTVRRELRALRHRTGDDRRRRRAEDRLENDKCHFRIAGVRADIPSRNEKVRYSDKAADVRAEHQPEADHPERDRANAKVHHVLHDDIACVLRAGQSRFHHREARLHEKYQRRAQKNPNRIGSRVPRGCAIRRQSNTRKPQKPSADHRRRSHTSKNPFHKSSPFFQFTLHATGSRKGSRETAPCPLYSALAIAWPH